MYARRRGLRSGHGPGLPLDALTRLRRLVLTGGTPLKSANEEPHKYMLAQQEVEIQARNIAEMLPLLEFLQLDEVCFHIQRAANEVGAGNNRVELQIHVKRLEDGIGMPSESVTEVGKLGYQQHAKYCRPEIARHPRHYMGHFDGDNLALQHFDYPSFPDVPEEDSWSEYNPIGFGSWRTISEL